MSYNPSYPRRTGYAAPTQSSSIRTGYETGYGSMPASSRGRQSVVPNDPNVENRRAIIKEVCDDRVYYFALYFPLESLSIQLKNP